MREEKYMFCRMCGHKIADGARFCPSCGAKVTAEEQSAASSTAAGTGSQAAGAEEGGPSGWHDAGPEEAQGYSSTEYSDSGAGNEKEKINWKEAFTAENIERFAPVAALFAVGRVVVGLVIGILMGILVLLVPFSLGIVQLVAVIISIVFIVVTGAAAGGLIYVAVNKKDPSKPETWVAPVAALLAFLSCLGTMTSWYGAAYIFGIISTILGIELFARIVISGQPMDSKVDYKAAFALYKKILDSGKKKNTEATTPEPYMYMEPSEFTGSGAELLGLSILATIVSLVTCGIAAPWMLCKIYHWRIDNTKINGKKLVFTGTGASLLGHWILWEVLTIVTCGLFSFFAHVALRKWELEHTLIEGEPVMPNEKVSYFDGGSFAYFGYGLLASLILILTLGLAYPWVMVMLQKWDTKHQVINGRRLAFNGTGLGFLGEYLIIFLLTLITCGIYGSWGVARMNRYIYRHTNFVD